MSIDKYEKTENIGDRIKELRTRLSVNQRDFAAALQTSPSYISDLEKKKSKPGYDLLLSIYRTYNISLEWLVAGEGSMFPGESENLEGKKEDISTEDIPKELMKEWLDYFWGQADTEEKTWLKVEMKKKFPDYLEWLKKRGM